ncbi:hypothetical protein ABH926_009440 [Catenulispora sp. GP43]
MTLPIRVIVEPSQPHGAGEAGSVGESPEIRVLLIKDRRDRRSDQRRALAIRSDGEEPFIDDPFIMDSAIASEASRWITP